MKATFIPGNNSSILQGSNPLTSTPKTGSQTASFRDLLKAPQSVANEARQAEKAAITHTLNGGDIAPLAFQLNELQINTETILAVQQNLIGAIKKLQEITL